MAALLKPKGAWACPHAGAVTRATPTTLTLFFYLRLPESVVGD